MSNYLLIKEKLDKLPIEDRRKFILALSASELQALNDLLPAPIPDLCINSSEAQKNFIKDPARFKVALCTRRASKSFSLGIMLVQEALAHNGTTSLYINKTIIVAERTLIKDIIQPLNQEFNLNLRIMKSPGKVIFPNESVIYLAGIDTDEQEKTKLLGQKYRMICADECQSYSIDLEDLIQRILLPSLSDLQGKLALAGTPDPNQNTYFYKLTSTLNSLPPFQLFKWGALENTSKAFNSTERICDLVKRDQDLLKAQVPGIEHTNTWKMQWEGQWVISTDSLVYKPHPFNFISNLPTQSYIYLLSIDLGWNDASSFVIGAYSKYDKHLYILEAFKKSKMDFTDVANKIKEYQQRYTFARIIIDAANLQGVQEIRRRHNINLIPADKKDKILNINLFNSDLDMGNILILPQASTNIKEEWDKLIYLDKINKVQEHPDCENHISDALLYLWRNSRNYQAQTLLPKLSEEQLYEQRLSEHNLHNKDLLDILTNE